MQEPESILDVIRDALRAGLATGTPVAMQPAASEGASGAPAAGAAKRSGASAVSASAGGATTPASGSLAGITILVSAAGTREALDPVRYIGNRSSGRMGYALASEAARHGARVLLVSGPSHLADPPGVAEVVRVETAAEMLAALRERLASADVLLMAAAVADYRPAAAKPEKMKRGKGGMQLDLVPTADILVELGAAKGGKLFVGFALETQDPEAEARAKLQRKGLDLVVANRVGPGTGPDSDTNQVWVYDAGGLVLETPRLDKTQIAAAILGVVEAELERRRAHAGA
jgi:phosphopantothenoylcysteine decarboxylase/phosphopantothenate--cysteine ligase